MPIATTALMIAKYIKQTHSNERMNEIEHFFLLYDKFINFIQQMKSL